MNNLPLTAEEIAQFRNGDLEIDGDVFDRLYTHYTSTACGNPMPYGIAKARTGDPYQWIADTLDKELK